MIGYISDNLLIPILDFFHLSSRISESFYPFLNDIDTFINGGFETEEEVEAEISVIDEVFVPPQGRYSR